MPAQAGYKDSDYATKSGLWPQLFYYAERLGYQLAAARRNQVLIMPFFTQAAANTGIFAPNWQDIVVDILSAVRASVGKDDGTQIAISKVAISSFSVGIVYLAEFRQLAPSLDSFLAEIWDFDGRFSSRADLSIALTSTAQVEAIKYDQLFSTAAGSYHVPAPRWTDYVQPPATGVDVHHLIRDFMFFHAASVTGVGSAIGVDSGTGTTGTSGTTDGTGATGGTGTTVTTGTTGAPGGTTTGATGTTATTSGTGTTAGTGVVGAGTGATGGTGVPELPPSPPLERPPAPPAPPVLVPPTTANGGVRPPSHPLPPSPVRPVPDGVTAMTPATPPLPTVPQPQPESCCCSGAWMLGSLGLVSTTAITAITANAAGARRGGNR